jgi:hypothetical protein
MKPDARHLAGLLEGAEVRCAGHDVDGVREAGDGLRLDVDLVLLVIGDRPEEEHLPRGQ